MATANLRLRITSTSIGGRGGAGSSIGTAARLVTGALAAAGRGVARIAKTVGSAVKGMMTFRTAALLLAPAMYTMGKMALALAGGAVVLGAVVTAAIAPWVGLAVTAAKNADKMGRAGAQFERATGGVKRAWMALAKATAPETLGPVTDVLDGITAAIPKLQPLVRDVAPTFAKMGKDIRNWLSGNGLERAIQNIRDYGVPAFRNLVAAGKDFLATMGIAFRNFLPVARDIGETIRSSAAKALRGGRKGGFAKFLNGVKRDWPEANRALRETGILLNTVGGVIASFGGEGGLNAVSGFLDAALKVDPQAAAAFLAGIGALFMGKRLGDVIGILLRMSRGGTTIAGGAALSAAAGALSAAAGPLLSLATRIAGLARRLASTRVDSSALRRIAELFESIRDATATFSIPSVNGVTVALMAIGSTWAAITTNFASAAVFSARVDTSMFMGAAALILVAWVAVRISAAIPAVFVAAASPGNVPAVAAMITGLWLRVRALAAVPAIFRVTATPGNVPGVASSIVAAWSRVRAAAAVVPRFSAIGIAGPVIAGAAAIIAAWMRVVSMPKLWTGIGIVSPGNSIGASSSIVSAWRRVLGLARSWSAVANCTWSGGFGGLGGDMTFNYNSTSKPFVTFQPAIPRPGGGFIVPDFPSDPGGATGGLFTGRSFKTYGASAAVAATAPLPPTRRGGSGRDIHIYEDVWIQSDDDLVELLSGVLK